MVVGSRTKVFLIEKRKERINNNFISMRGTDNFFFLMKQKGIIKEHQEDAKQTSYRIELAPVHECSN